MSSWVTHPFALRARVIGVAAVVAIAARACEPAPPAPTVEGVATMLGQSVGGVVRAGEFRWEASDGVLVDNLLGRRVLFLASASEGQSRDLYRARVRVSFEGRPIGVVGPIFNLTSTPLGDDAGLTGDGPTIGRYAAFASRSYGTVTSITLLDTAGDGGVVGAQNAFETFLGHLTNLQETGSWEGIGRAELSFMPSPASVAFQFEPGALVVSPSGSQAQRIPVEGSGDSELGIISIHRLPHLRKNAVLWAVDSVRAVVGPGPIAWMEDTFFGARDKVRQTTHAAFGEANTAVVAASADAPPPSPPLDASAAGEDGGYWPPSRLPSIWKNPDQSEGTWEPVTYPFLKKLPGATSQVPAYFYRTYIKADAQRPYAKVLVVAMDTRQLEVNMEGGVEDPKPLTGGRGLGRIPREPEILSRVVGAFNGAFKTTHGAYGMMANKRLLLPPKQEAATVVVTEDHKVGMGSWRRSEDDIPKEIVSFRQNLDPLVEDGMFNPRNRTQWGFQLAGTSVMTERSGICVTKAGHFFYLWGDDVSGSTLGKAMVQAGCQYGMHLDMNPKHTGFVFTDIRDVHKKQYDAKLLSDGMEIQPERYIEWSPKDFFYVMLREAAVARPSSKLKWTVDKGAQPAPVWLPGVFESSFTHDGVGVQLIAFEPERALFRVKPARSDGVEGSLDLDAEDAKKVLLAVGVGSARGGRGLGFRLDGKQLVPFRGQSGYLWADETGALKITEAQPPANAPVAVELPLVVTASKVTLSADERGASRPRAAACMTSDGRVIIASSSSESDRANATALIEAGCTSAAALDRGSHQDGFVQRAGVGGGQVARGEQTTLYAIATPMRPRGFIWK
ncbi:MAG: hypothetical protein U0165_04115 [Polyangiaceae bacterium]